MIRLPEQQAEEDNGRQIGEYVHGGLNPRTHVGVDQLDTNMAAPDLGVSQGAEHDQNHRTFGQFQGARDRCLENLSADDLNGAEEHCRHRSDPTQKQDHKGDAAQRLSEHIHDRVPIGSKGKGEGVEPETKNPAAIR